jgi:hypothetical protein
MDEVKEIRDQAEVMRAYARQAKNKQLEIEKLDHCIVGGDKKSDHRAKTDLVKRSV